MKVLGKQVYRFEGIEVDLRRGCLRLSDGEVYLRQKAMQVLVYLLEQRHRLVTKDELIKDVWEGAAVTDDALVQLIKEVRKALGDDPRRPRFIKTVPKAGYRFIAPVEEAYPTELAILRLEESTSVEVEFGEVAEGDPGWPTVEAPGRMASPLRQRWLSRRSILAATTVLTVVALAAYLGATYLLESPRRHKGQPAELTLPQVPGKKSVAVTYFENQSGSSELHWLREGLAELLITNLSRSKKLVVLSRQRFHLLLERIGQSHEDVITLDAAMEIGRKSQAEVVVLGSFARLGEKVCVNVHLYGVQTGRQLAAESVIADQPGDIFTQIELLAFKLATHLGASPGEQEGRTRLAGVMTNNLDAYRYYSLAVEKAQAYHSNEALDLLEKATRLDPEFAMAYARIGYTYALVRVNEAGKAGAYLQKALQLSHRLTDKDKLHINAWYALASGDKPEGVRLLRELISEHPHEQEAYLRLGYELGHLERPDEAIATYRQGLLFDPESRDIYNALGFAYWHLCRYEEAIAAHRNYVQLAPAEPNAHDSLGLTYMEAGRYEEAAVEFERALALNPDFHFATLHLGDMYFGLGRYGEASRQYRRFLEFAPSDWDAAVGHHRLALLYLKKGDLQRAEAAARQEVKHKNDFGGRLLVALARGDLRAAEKVKKEFFAGTLPPQLTWKAVHYLRGCYAAKSGRGVDALDHFKEALGRPPRVWNVDGVEDCLANAYLEQGRLDEAVAEYERILRLNPNYPPAHYHLAQACERKGDREKARSHYQRFAEIWHLADPDLPEIIAAKRYLTAPN